MAVLALALPAGASAEALGKITEFSSPTEPTFPFMLAEGSDGNVWFTDPENPNTLSGKKIGRATPAGEVSVFSPTGMSGGAYGIAKGPDGNVWFTEPTVKKVGYIKPAEPTTSLKEFEVPNMPTEPGFRPVIAAGPDGNLWVTLGESGIARVTPAGVVSEFKEGLNAGAEVCSIAAGPDGNVWFGDCGTPKKAIGRITPSGEIKVWEVAGTEATSSPSSIALGPDGRLWFLAKNAADERLGAITTTGTITYYKTPTDPSDFALTSLTAGPDGNIWATEKSGVSESQTVSIKGTGGTLKLGFEGKETGATGSGNLLSSAKGKGTIKRYPTTVTNATCTRTAGSNELKSCNNTPSTNAEVGMRIAGNGIPTETLITKVEGTTITLSKNVTGSGSTPNINAGRVLVSETTSGKFEPGQSVTGTGISGTGTIISTEEKEGKVVAFAIAGTTTSAGITSASGTATEPSASTTTVVTGVKTSSGAFSKGEVITGTGIPAATTITAVSTTLNTLTLSATPTEAGTGVSLSADLLYKASSTVVQEALEKLSTIGTGSVQVGIKESGEIENPETKEKFKEFLGYSVLFMGKLARTDVPLVGCDASKLSGTEPSCTVKTTSEARPQALVRITPAGALTTFLVKGSTYFFPYANGLISGPGGNLWYTSGTSTPNAIGKFGTESTFKPLWVTKKGTASGTVTSSPAAAIGLSQPFNCGNSCIGEFELGTEVTLSQTPDKFSEFTGWSGACSGTGTCKVTMSEAKEVTANYISQAVLTVKATGKTLGYVISSPAGIKCGGSNNKCEIGYKAEEAVKVSLSPAPNSVAIFTGWSGACSGKGACEVTLSESKTVTASFVEAPKELIVEKTGTGKGTVTSSPAAINCGETCNAFFETGSTVSLSAEAGEDSRFTGWTGCSSEVEGKCLVTMSKDLTVKANFINTYPLTVSNTGTGTGTVTSSPSGINCGSECSASFDEGTEVTLSQEAAEGSSFTGWSGACSGTGECKVTMSAAKEVTANFKLNGPTNRRTVTVTKSPAGNAGAGLGTVSSKPKGIKCAQTCNEAVGRFYKEQAVVLTAAPSGETSSFDKWEGCPEPAGLICTVPTGNEGKSVKAVFKGTSKAFTPAVALSLSKGKSEDSFGWGTVKASGLTCEAECDETTVLYQGPITGLKAKPGKTVELKEIPAFGSKFVGWSGACSGTETSCKVTMEEAKSVTAEFAALPNKALTVQKAYSGGLGSVMSKAKGINCGSTCTATSANMPEGTAVLLTAKPVTTTPATTFVKWEGGDCEGKTEATCTVTMDGAETVKAVFSGPVKAIVNPKSLSLSKEGSGYGTVKAAGLTCEVLCTGATSLYYGPVTGLKAKPGAKVILKAIPAPGSTAVTWSGCKVLSATECEVVMGESSASVTATFDELK